MNIPKRKIEKPETLEEAYKLIESMRNTATKSFFRFLREGNLEGVKEQYKIGADIYGREEGSDLTCLEVVAEEKEKLYAPNGNKKNEEGNSLSESVDLEKYKESIRNTVKVFSTIEKWLRLNGADAAIMFYLLASNEDEEGIVRNRERYSINACDEKGHTAVDIALMKSEYKVAKLLNKCGGVINSRCRANARIVRCVDNVCKWYEDLSKEECEFLANTMEMGLSPDIGVSLEYDDHGYEVSQFEKKYCTLFGAAIENAKYNVVEACLQKGIDVNKEVIWTRMVHFGFGECEYVIDKKGTPWDILSKHKGVNDELRSRFKELFLRYGAQISSEA